jgi:hypothetical protein
MSIRMRSAVIAIVLLVPGCAVQTDLVPISGSRSDGVVNLAYEIGPFQRAEVDYAGGAEAARQRCQAWGFSGAQPMGGATTRCIGNNGSCAWQRVTIPFQCTGAPAGR